MSDETDPRRKARECVDSGKIPNRSPDRLYGGRGTGADCVICGAPVVPDQIEFEIEFDRNVPGSGVDKYLVHLACLSAWESERRKNRVSAAGSTEGWDPADPVVKWRAS